MEHRTRLRTSQNSRARCCRCFIAAAALFLRGRSRRQATRAHHRTDACRADDTACCYNGACAAAVDERARRIRVSALAPPPDVESSRTPSTMSEEPRVQRHPPPKSDLVALILPLGVPTYARAAEAVRAGFLAAAGDRRRTSEVIVIGHKEDGVARGIRSARGRAVYRVVIGVVADDLKDARVADPEIPWTVALIRSWTTARRSRRPFSHLR